MKKQIVSLVICNKNEVRTIKKLLDAAKKFVDEVIVMDGNSIDGSKELVKSLKIKIYGDNGKGKGAAIRQSIKLVKGNIIVFIDADGSHEPLDIPKLIKPISDNAADMVIASRGKGGSDELNGSIEKIIRLVGSSIITLIINLRFHAKLSDTQNGFRAIKKSAIAKLKLKENIFTIEQEMVIKALKRNFRISEIPSHEYSRKFGSSHICLSKMSMRYVWNLITNII